MSPAMPVLRSSNEEHVFNVYVFFESCLLTPSYHQLSRRLRRTLNSLGVLDAANTSPTSDTIDPVRIRSSRVPAHCGSICPWSSKMVTLTIDNETYQGICKKAAARGLSVEDWLKSEGHAGNLGPQPEAPIGEQMAKLFAEIGLTDEESIPELKGQAVRSPEFE